MSFTLGFEQTAPVSRIDLRPLDESDAQSLIDVISRNRQHLSDWGQDLEDVRTATEAREFIIAVRQAANAGFVIKFGIFTGGRLVGMLEIYPSQYSDDAMELGYWIDRAYEGRGVVTGACEEALERLFNATDIQKAIIRCTPGNDRSSAVARRLGFTFSGLVPDSNLRDHNLFILDRNDWNCAKVKSVAA